MQHKDVPQHWQDKRDEYAAEQDAEEGLKVVDIDEVPQFFNQETLDNWDNGQHIPSIPSQIDLVISFAGGYTPIVLTGVVCFLLGMMFAVILVG